jgi:hypothetical protein
MTRLGDTVLFKGADLSTCDTYRYRLWRRWGDGPLVNFIMLNPSTAGAKNDDPTIRRCIGLAKAWGHPGITVTNLFAYRTSSPRMLLQAARDGVNVVGTSGSRAGLPNNVSLINEALSCSVVVAAWGNNGYIHGRDESVLHMLRQRGVKLHHLGLTKQRRPRHPLYLPKTTEPILWP